MKATWTWCAGEFATFFEAFPHGTVWGNDRNGEGYDVVLLGQQGETKIDVDAMQARLDRPDHKKVVASLDDIGLGSAILLLSAYAGQATDLQKWLKGAGNQPRSEPAAAIPPAVVEHGTRKA